MHKGWAEGILNRLRHQTSTGIQLRELDALRGLAVMLVVVGHYADFTRRAWAGSSLFDLNVLVFCGRAGVAIFFFISGFLLYMAWGKAHMDGGQGPDRWRFYKRRAYRIIPAYYFNMLVIVLLYGSVILSPTFSNGGWRDILYHVLFIHSISADTIKSINGVYWSLAAEAQFYIILPIIAGWFYGRRNILALPLFLCFAMCFKVALIHTFGADPYILSIVMWLMPVKLDEFAIGITFANILLYLNKGSYPDALFHNEKAIRLTFLPSVLLFCLLLYFFSRPTGTPYLVVFDEELLLVVFGVLTLSAIKGGVGKIILVNPVMEFIGIISYSMFLWHVPILLEVGRIAKQGGPHGLGYYLCAGVFCSIITIAISVLSYILLEKPFLKLRHGKAAATRR